MTEETKTEEPQSAGQVVAVANFDDMFAAEGASGLENLTAQDLRIPYLALLQDLSKQVKKQNALYVEGAEPGMMLNTITQQLFKNETGGVDVIPVHWEKTYTEWKVGRGGFVQRHGPEILNQTARVQNANGGTDDVLPNGNVIETAAVYYVLIVSGGNMVKAILSLKKTNMKVSKRLATMLSMQQRINPGNGHPYTPPMFANVVNLSSVMEQDDKNSWWLWKPVIKGYIDQVFKADLAGYYFKEAKAFYESIIAGGVKIQDDPDAGDTDGASNVNTGAPDSGVGEDEIPF